MSGGPVDGAPRSLRAGTRAAARAAARAATRAEARAGALPLRAEGVTLGYGKGSPVLTGLDLEVAAGEILVVLGPSGCGKSTLLRAFAGLLPVTAGRVLADGVPVTGTSADRALMFQDDALLPWRTARRNVELALALRGVRRAERRAAAALEGFPLLAAAESAGSLVAAEMSHDGLPWSAEEHDALLTELLGPRPTGGLRPRVLQDLADRISAAFGGRAHVNPDSPAQIIKAFAAAGLPVSSTRAHVLKRLDHPAVPLLLEYKELARLHAAHGWAWLDTWVSGGRFRPEYVVGGVVSGRWATNGGGALQIPRVLRRAVVADPGWRLVVADAAQLEPRVLAALAGDRAFADAAAHGDLYAALSDAFSAGPAHGPARDRGGGSRRDPDALGPRDKAKLALLSAMYGGGTGEAVQLLGVLRSRFPDAFEYVEAAARAGERGLLVRSRLGRTCPPPSAGWRELTSAGDDDGEAAADGAARGSAAQALRSRGRFTRNFVVQATAADWALALLGSLRRRLARLGPPRLVFFQHDEVIVHTPAELAGEVGEAVRAAAEEARRLLFGGTPVVFPMEIAVVDRYSDAK
ncbi:bifunctional 3'-5' exonuclease/DNA polymerase [Actinomadura fibrosa]|uniref:bifunctional 3'-5' exonuclease/DNA polymerase n=1 Tax=Actinomadura fibrosa TaxID=111802 RepID=UPI0010413B7D|nr:bifunctional 3'-5' exonuclease/DNA polymerase [Actinomadura fibrosa]